MAAITPARGIFAAALAIALGNVAPAQTIPNPSFEVAGYANASPTFVLGSPGSNIISSWTIGGSAGVDYFRAPWASDGEYFVDLVRGPGQGGVIGTTITGLTPGLSYVVAFDFQTSTLVAGTRVTVTIDSVSLDFDATLASVWQTHTMDFTAASTTAALSLAGPLSGAVDGGVFVDNLTISAIPESGTCAALTAFAALAFACRLRPSTRTAPLPATP
jgi:hypothetical protein